MSLATSIAISMSTRARLLPLDLCTERLWDEKTRKKLLNYVVRVTVPVQANL